MKDYQDPPAILAVQDHPGLPVILDLLDLADREDPRDLAEALAIMANPAQRVTLASLGLQVYRAMWARTDLEDLEARQDHRAYRDRSPPTFPAPPGTRPARSR